MPPIKKKRIGVLALQGDFGEHINALAKLGVETMEVRRPTELTDLDGLIIPGGESTTIRKLMTLFKFDDPIVDFVHGGKSIWGTCAGMIVIARELTDPYPTTLNLIDIKVSRNWFGRQTDSFEDDFEFKGITGGPFRSVFIRAPIVLNVGPKVEVIASIEGGHPVAVRSGNILATAFHPELTDDLRIHKYFVDLTPDKNKRDRMAAKMK